MTKPKVLISDKMDPNAERILKELGVAFRFTVLESHLHPASLCETGDFHSEMNRVALFAPHRFAQDRKQVRSIDREIRKAVARDRLGAEVEQLPCLAGAPEADFFADRLARQRAQRDSTR